MNYGLLANQGRREDNAQLGGQVAHISQQDAQILRALGGAGTTNPATGLPEYFNAGLAGQGFGLGGFSGHSAAGLGGTAASFGSFGQGTGGTASGVTGVGPGSSGVGSGLAGATLGGIVGDGGGGDSVGGGGGDFIGPPTLAQARDAAKAKAKSLGYNWGDAVQSVEGLQSMYGGWGDQTMNAIFNLVSKISPTVIAIKAIKGLLGEGGEGGGDGQTQTVTAAPPAISSTYAPTTGSIPSPLPPPVPIAPPEPIPAPVVQTATAPATPYAGGLKYTPLPFPTTETIPPIPTYSLPGLIPPTSPYSLV